MTKTPLYRKVQDDLADLIRGMQVGEMLPTEPELEVRFGVGRATVRRAVENLVREGVLARRQGVGTSVREHPETQDVGRVYSWSAEMRHRNVSTSSSHLSIHLEKPSRRLIEEMRLGRGENVVVISRVRHVKDVPIAIMVNYLRERYVPGLVERGLSGESLYDDLIDNYGLELVAGDEIISAREATPLEASLLNVPEGASLLNIRRITYTRGNVPLEVVDMAARGDKYQYHAKLAGTARTRTQP